MGKFILFAVAILTFNAQADENFMFALQGKEISVNQDGVVLCTSGCSEEEKSIPMSGDRVDFTFDVWYVAGPTVFGRVDGGVACPSGLWYAIDTYGLRVQALKLPTCNAVTDTKMVATGGKIEYTIVQGNAKSRYVFTE